MKLLIDKEKIELRIAKLEQTDEFFSQGSFEEHEFLQSILQQGEEYNENEVIEFADYLEKEGWSGALNPGTWFHRKKTTTGYRHTTQELFKLYKNERKK